MLPDDLLELIERSSVRHGTDWRDVVAEMLAHFTLKESDTRAAIERAKRGGG